MRVGGKQGGVWVGMTLSDFDFKVMCLTYSEGNNERKDEKNHTEIDYK